MSKLWYIHTIRHYIAMTLYTIHYIIEMSLTNIPVGKKADSKRTYRMTPLKYGQATGR